MAYHISILARIKKEIFWFKDVSFFQFIRALNHQVDTLAKEAGQLSEGSQ
jgi:hypothetical protein